MSLFSTITLLSFISIQVNAGHILHESRQLAPSNWNQLDRAPSNQVLPLRIYLAQSNVNNMDALLARVSDPDSPEYAQHYTAQEVRDLFAPSQQSVDAVKEWLRSADVQDNQIVHANSKGWLQVDMPVTRIEDLLHATYHVYQHEHHEIQHIAASHYSIPEHLVPHIDFITPTVHFDHALKPNVAPTVPSAHKKQRRTRFSKRAVPRPVVNPLPVDRPRRNAVSLDKAKKLSLSTCDQYTTLACLQAQYGIPKNTKLIGPNELGIIEFSPNYLQQDNLASFMTLFVKGAKKEVYWPKTDLILGAKLYQKQVKSPDDHDMTYYMEGNLDAEYATGLTYPSQLTVYQVGPDSGKNKGLGSFNNFLDAIDKSYCTADGGDVVRPGVFDIKTPKSGCGQFKAAKVLSLSYSYNEVDLTAKYEKRQCNEYAKLGLQGTTVVVSSGDFGVASNTNLCLDPKQGTKFNNDSSFIEGYSGLFVPNFPATCPYVTSVGATQLDKGAAVGTREVVAFDPSSAFSSGGGFSNVFSQPAWQAKAVNKYLSSAKLPNKKMWQSNGKARGYPDLSAAGSNYLVEFGFDKFYGISGTSASAPTVAAIFAMINQARAEAGKKSIGFANPALYAHASALTDITSGHSSGCGTNGFSAAKGWDPVSGLGTPKFQSLRKAFLDLP